MADTETKSESSGERLPLGPQPELKASQQQIASAIEHVRDNALLYVVGAAFLVLVALATVLVTISQQVETRETITQYAQAVENEDPALRASELEVIAGDSSKWGIEAQYMLGESALEAKQYEQARKAFETIVNQHADKVSFTGAPSVTVEGINTYVTRSADALAFLLENEGDREGALAAYKDLVSRWPESFVARRAYRKIGELHEALGQFEAAIAAYEEQLTAFPGSRVAARAQTSLDELRASHPDLFPEPVAVTEGETEGAAATTTEAAADNDAAGDDEDAPVVTEEAAETTSEPEAPETDVEDTAASATDEAPDDTTDAAVPADETMSTDDAAADDAAATAEPPTDVAPEQDAVEADAAEASEDSDPAATEAAESETDATPSEEES